MRIDRDAGTFYNACSVYGAGAVAATSLPIRSYRHHYRSPTTILGWGVSADRSRARAADHADRLNLFEVGPWSHVHHGLMIGLSPLGRRRHRGALRLSQALGRCLPLAGSTHLRSSIIKRHDGSATVPAAATGRGYGRQGPLTSAPARRPHAPLILWWRTPEIPIASK